MNYYFPFGEVVRPLMQRDKDPKKVFVLGVYASAVHACWKKDSKVICQALAVASEPYIFWDGNPREAKNIIDNINFPKKLGTLEPADPKFNGPSAKVLDKHILAPLGYSRKDAWLCDLLPETRLNDNQLLFIENTYDKYYREQYGLNKVTVPKRPEKFCDLKRCEEIIAELDLSEAGLLVLLGDILIKQFLNVVADVEYKSLKEYRDLYGYGNPTEANIDGKRYQVLPLAHPRQIGGLGSHSSEWFDEHKKWEKDK